ncbi:MAG: sialidase family protein [Thermoplasmata archaeon]
MSPLLRGTVSVIVVFMLSIGVVGVAVQEVQAAPAGWSDYVVLSNSSVWPEKNMVNTSENPAVTSWGNYVYAVWERDTMNASVAFVTNAEIFFSRSDDYGYSWSTPVRLTYNYMLEDNLKNNTAYGNSVYPRIAVNGSQVHIVYDKAIYGAGGGNKHREIMYINSTDRGNTFSEPRMLTTNDTEDSRHPDIDVCGDRVHIVWTDERDADADLFYMNSSDGGLTWSPEQKITFGGVSGTSRIAVNNSNIHITYNRYIPPWEVAYMKSTDGGVSWSPTQILSPNDGFPSLRGGIDVYQDNVHVVYDDANPPSIGYRSSNDNGDTWSSEITLDSPGNRSEQPTIGVWKDEVYTAWIDNRDHYDYQNAFEIYTANSTDGGNTWTDDLRLSNAVNKSLKPDVCANESIAHVVWQDNRTGEHDQDYEIYYKRNPGFGVPIPEFRWLIVPVLATPAIIIFLSRYKR